jgi:hypothetical protein
VTKIQRSIAAAAAFRERLAEVGATLLEDTWLGGSTPHRVRCAEGHHCTPRPNNVRNGQGVCRACGGKDPQAAEAAFRVCLEAAGATLLEDRWLGRDKPHRVRCVQGHHCTVRPNNAARWGVCRACAGKDPQAAEAEFRDRLVELGATLLEARWLGANRPHRVRCAEGHHCTPRPNHVRQGVGICPACAGKSWDVLYVVSDESGETVKVGITNGDHRPRLRTHRSDGLDQVIRLLPGLPEGVAQELERNVLAALRDAGERSTRGREYFPGRALPLMLDVIDHHPDVRLPQRRRPVD